ncbi:MAG: FeoB-associated Cys-rich membrane protein [Erysipelotrichaceae bacterium]|nr:FeoB-associated Cys-rich membrane protein [Erysipelotrichaceae bacterium]MBQ4251860.1 FeoB-associated Cys-rich membrane protein [Erysipelotrichaceae bacterium]
MNPADVIIILLIAGLLYLAIRSLRKKPNSCSCGCQGCSYAGNCEKMKTKKR